MQIPYHDTRIGASGDQKVLSADAHAEHGFDKVCVGIVFLAGGAGEGVPAPDGFVPAAGKKCGIVRAEGEAGEWGSGAAVEVRFVICLGRRGSRVVYKSLVALCWGIEIKPSHPLRARSSSLSPHSLPRTLVLRR